MSDRYHSSDSGRFLRVSPSRAYHHYWQGYTEVREERENGSSRIKRVYTAPWKRQAISDRNWILLKLLYGVLIVCAVCCHILALSRRVSSNYSIYVAVPGLTGSLGMFLFVIFAGGYILSPRKMTLWEYISSTKRIKAASLAVGVLECMTAAVTLAYTLISARDMLLAELGCIALLLVAAGASFAIRLIEDRVPYEDLSNDTPVPEGGSPIW